MDLDIINFWKRLEAFVKNVQVNDMPSEEEKQMILKVCEIKSNLKKEDLYVWDGISGSLEEINDIEDGKQFIRENFVEDGGIHPDIECVFIVKKVASVYVEETDETTELDGENVPICKVTIE